MKYKTLSSFNLNTDEAINKFKALYPNVDENDDIFVIFKIACENNMSLFPAISLSDNECTADAYIKKWRDRFFNFELPSKRKAEKKKTCDDPAIKEMVKAIYPDSDDKQMELENKLHNLFMAAENAQGNLLEEYIYENINNLGWIWCKGNTLKSVDFCSFDGSYLLQIKNKNNTENSSSSAIREGTEIKKWFRLGSKKNKNVYIPDFKWADLNTIINEKIKDGVEEQCAMSEESYESFLQEVMLANPDILKND